MDNRGDATTGERISQALHGMDACQGWEYLSMSEIDCKGAPSQANSPLAASTDSSSTEVAADDNLLDASPFFIKSAPDPGYRLPSGSTPPSSASRVALPSLVPSDIRAHPDAIAMEPGSQQGMITESLQVRSELDSMAWPESFVGMEGVGCESGLHSLSTSSSRPPEAAFRSCGQHQIGDGGGAHASEQNVDLLSSSTQNIVAPSERSRQQLEGWSFDSLPMSSSCAPGLDHLPDNSHGADGGGASASFLNCAEQGQNVDAACLQQILGEGSSKLYPFLSVWEELADDMTVSGAQVSGFRGSCGVEAAESTAQRVATACASQSQNENEQQADHEWVASGSNTACLCRGLPCAAAASQASPDVNLLELEDLTAQASVMVASAAQHGLMSYQVSLTPDVDSEDPGNWNDSEGMDAWQSSSCSSVGGNQRELSLTDSDSEGLSSNTLNMKGSVASAEVHVAASKPLRAPLYPSSIRSAPGAPQGLAVVNCGEMAGSSPLSFPFLGLHTTGQPGSAMSSLVDAPKWDHRTAVRQLRHLLTSQATTLWSLAVTTTAFCLLIAAQRWQQVRRQNRALRAQLSQKEEMISQMSSQITRLKEALATRRRVPVLRTSASTPLFRGDF